MIGHFPVPYPDEVLYSVLARSAGRLSVPSAKHFMQELFGSSNSRASVNFAGRLGKLASNLPPGHPLTADVAIAGHTMYPLVSPFLSKACASELHSRMTLADGRSLDFLTGTIQSRISRKLWFYSCPNCDAWDLERCGEHYWHRLFQVSGVCICPIHKVFLNRSLVERPEGKLIQRYIPASVEVLDAVARPVDLTTSENKDKFQLARAAEWLLSKSPPPLGIDALRQAYLSQLAQLGFLTGSGRVDQSHLRQEFLNRLPASFLTWINSRIGRPDQDDWLARLLRQDGTATPPIRHLLLLLFLDWPPAELFENARANQLPQPQKLWPCRNPVCKDFGNKSVSAIEWKFVPEHNEKVFTLRCSTCDYTYSCRPHSKRIHVVDHGTSWKNLLRKRWLDLRLSLREISREFRADPMTIKRHAAALGLAFPRLSVRPTRCRPVALAHRKRSRLAFLKKEWLSAREANPCLGRQQLRKRFSGLYAAIYRSDRSWLLSHQPKRRTYADRPSRVNWRERDVAFESRVQEVAHLILSDSERPRRVSATALCAKLGAAWIERHRRKLPRTWLAIKRASESRVTFAIRRVNLVAKKLLREGKGAPFWQIRQAAGLRREIACLPIVERAIQAVQNGSFSNTPATV
jgi:hypothetical protein